MVVLFIRSSRKVKFNFTYNWGKPKKIVGESMHGKKGLGWIYNSIIDNKNYLVSS